MASRTGPSGRSPRRAEDALSAGRGSGRHIESAPGLALGWRVAVRSHPLGGNILRVRWLAVLTCLLGVLALGATACGDDDDEGDSGGSANVSGDTLTIYSSLP